MVPAVDVQGRRRIAEFGDLVQVVHREVWASLRRCHIPIRHGGHEPRDSALASLSSEIPVSIGHACGNLTSQILPDRQILCCGRIEVEGEMLYGLVRTKHV